MKEEGKKERQAYAGWVREEDLLFLKALYPKAHRSLLSRLMKRKGEKENEIQAAVLRHEGR